MKCNVLQKPGKATAISERFMKKMEQHRCACVSGGCIQAGLRCAVCTRISVLRICKPETISKVMDTARLQEDAEDRMCHRRVVSKHNGMRGATRASQSCTLCCGTRPGDLRDQGARFTSALSREVCLKPERHRCRPTAMECMYCCENKSLYLYQVTKYHRKALRISKHVEAFFLVSHWEPSTSTFLCSCKCILLYRRGSLSK